MQLREPTRNEMSQLRELLYQYGDIPDSEVVHATTPGKRRDWLVIIQDGHILCAGRVDKSDWYEITMKNLFTVPEARGMGLGTEITNALYRKAEEREALTVKADITSTNVASKGTIRDLGFQQIGTFDWNEKKPSADVYMKVLKQPDPRKLPRQERVSQHKARAYQEQMRPLEVQPTEVIWQPEMVSKKNKKKKTRQSSLDDYYPDYQTRLF